MKEAVALAQLEGRGFGATEVRRAERRKSLQDLVEIGQTRLDGEQETAPNQEIHSVKKRPELVDGKLCRIVHPTTLSHFAPGI